MIDFQTLQKSWFFETIELKKWSFLFREGDIDIYLYIIQQWEMSVEKDTLLDKKTKRLAIIWKESIIGEWTLCHSSPKEVSIIAVENTLLLRIDTKKSFPDFVKDYPRESFEILKSIIEITNSRLLRANREITSNYEVIQAINKLENEGIQGIFSLLDGFQKILTCDFLLFFENNTAVDNYCVLKYNSQEQWKLQDIIVEKKSMKLEISDIQREKIPLGKFQILETVGTPENILWYLVICNREKLYREEDHKILSSMAHSLLWIVRQKKFLEEEKNRIYIKKSRK
jgi:Cyclic nucleotide-binding domain